MYYKWASIGLLSAQTADLLHNSQVVIVLPVGGTVENICKGYQSTWILVYKKPHWLDSNIFKYLML